MHDRFEKRIEDDLTRLAGRLERAKKKPNRSQVERQIGRVLGRNSLCRWSVRDHGSRDRAWRRERASRSDLEKEERLAGLAASERRMLRLTYEPHRLEGRRICGGRTFS